MKSFCWLSFTILFVTVVAFVRADGIDDSEKEILNWKAPEELKKKYPFYLSGYDYEGSPVFVAEIGKWDFRSAVEAGPEATEQLDKLMTQMFLTWRTVGSETPEGTGSLVIADMEGMDIRQAGHFGVVQLLLRQFPKFEKLMRRPGLKKIIVVNANYLVERIYEMGRPLLGQVSNLIELHGTNAGKWKPVLLKEVPADQLPAWYGGSENHKVIKVYGK